MHFDFHQPTRLYPMCMCAMPCACMPDNSEPGFIFLPLTLSNHHGDIASSQPLCVRPPFLVHDKGQRETNKQANTTIAKATNKHWLLLFSFN